MKIREVNEDKKQFISLLLLADEQENMVDRYLEKGTMYVLEDGDVKAECVVTDEYSVLQVGTGDSPLTIPFYEKCGFVRSNKIPNFFTDNYDHPIYEGCVQLIDMVYLHVYRRSVPVERKTNCTYKSMFGEVIILEQIIEYIKRN